MPRVSLSRAFLVLFLFCPAATALAQTRKPLTIQDYSRWRAIEGAVLSPDGLWLAYTLRLTNVLPAESKPVLHLQRLETGQETEIEGGSSPAFSPDSRWVLYQLDSVPAPRRRADTTGADSARATRPASKPPRMELRELGSGTVRTWERMRSGRFSPGGAYVVLHRRSPPAQRGASPGGPPQAQAGSNEPRGADAVVHQLATGRSLFLGSVGEFAFPRAGNRLAYTVEATPNDANGVFLLDLTSGQITPLDNDAKSYTRLAWNEAGTGLAVLKGKPVDKMRERENVLLVFPDLGKPRDPALKPLVLDPAQTTNFRAGWVVSTPADLGDDHEEVTR